jgi:hypothetical protein
MRDIHSHIDEEELEQYSAGCVTGGQTAALEEHLLICEECRNNLEHTDEYVAAMRSAANHERRAVRTKLPQGLPLYGLSVFAAVACALLLFIAVQRRQASALPPAAVDLIAMRGTQSAGIAPADRALLLRPDLTGLAASASYSIQVVDQTGRELRRSLMNAGRGNVQFEALKSGTYFVRVYLPGGQLLREYGLEVR